MKYATVCSGIEAPSLAWHGLGWSPVFFSEIEKFPSAVLSHYYPDVPNLGDMNNLLEDERSRESVIDVFCGGTPCQSFSVAGLRKGLDDPRGNLALVFLRIVNELRPRWVVWENVPGILSSSGGRDFGAFLGAMGELGYGWAYRVLDAQFFGVAQQRRRVFVVGCLGGWTGAAAVLFEQEGMYWNPPPRRSSGQKVTDRIAPCLTSSGKAAGSATQQDAEGGMLIVTGDIAPTLMAHPSRLNPEEESFVFTQNSRDEVRFVGGDGSRTGALTAQAGAKQKPYLLKGQKVRRLTPLEHERLQGMPDNYTRIPYRGKTPENCPDGPRYRAIGNSMAVPVMRWLGQRIQLVDSIISN